LRSLRGAGDWSAFRPPDDGLLLVDELALEFVLLDESMLELLGVVLVEDELVEEGLVVEFVDGVVDEFVEDGMAFGSVCEVGAAPLPGEAAVLPLFADCECETPTAAVRAAANATELQVRDLFIQ
jgi:hypothetical protein